MRTRVLLPFMLVVLILVMAGCQTNQNPNPAGQSSGQSTPTPQINTTQNQNDTTTPSTEKTAQLQQIKAAAKEGKVPGCDFAARNTNFDAIEKAWGQPQSMQYIAEAKGTYASYAGRKIDFGFNKGMQVFEVRSYSSEVQKINSADVRTVLGEPVMFRVLGTQQMYGYQAGDYRLEFIFNTPTQQPQIMVDHINVLYPPATVNMMADDPGRQW